LEQINYSSSGGILLYMQRMVFNKHLGWLAASTIRVPPTNPTTRPHPHPHPRSTFIKRTFLFILTITFSERSYLGGHCEIYHTICCSFCRYMKKKALRYIK